MSTEFTLELYFENDDGLFAENEAKKLKALVSKLAPHVILNVLVMKATNIVRSIGSVDGKPYNVPNNDPSLPGRQSLVITGEDIGFGRHGLAGANRGCLSKRSMQEKADVGADSADITIHEWLHTIQGKLINGRPVPDPDTNASFGFRDASGRSPDGQDTWHKWYRFALRAHP